MVAERPVVPVRPRLNRPMWKFQTMNLLGVLYLSVVSFIQVINLGSAKDILLTGNETDYIKEKQEELCGYGYLCSDSFRRSDEVSYCCLPCRCDDLCHEYGDCCADKAITDKLNSRTLDYTRYKCKSNEFKPVRIARKFFFRSIQKCSLRHDDNNVQLCENPNPKNLTLAIPARAGDHLYRNQFCALCNGETDYTLWEIKAECKVRINIAGLNPLELIQSFVNDPACDIVFQPSDNLGYRSCFPSEEEAISSCKVSEQYDGYDFGKLCLSYYAPVKVYGHIYHNIFCYMCKEGYRNDETLCQTGSPGPGIFPISLILDPMALQTIQNTASSPSECGPNYIHDGYMEECKLVECAPYHILRDEVCSPAVRSLDGLHLVYHLEVLLKPETSLKIQHTTDVFIQLIGEKLMSEFVGWRTIHMELFRVGVRIRKSPTVREVSSVSVSTIVLSWEIDISRMESTLLQLRHSDWIILIDNATVTFKAEPFWTDPGDKTLYPRVTEEVIDDENSIFRYDLFIDPTIDVDLYVSETLKCPRVKVFQDIDYTYDKSDNLMKLIRSNKTLDIGQFEPLSNNSGFVCFTSFKENVTDSASPSLLFPTHLIYSSLISQVMSLICLFLTFLVFCIFKSLRTLPGKNTMSLVFTLFVALLLFTVGSARVEIPVLCKIIGISIHFFLVSSFTWMAVCTLHMFRIFRNILESRQTDSTNKRTYNLYLIISIILPGVIVGSTVAGNHFTSKGQDIGYGTNICYVSNFYTVVLAVAAPVAFVVVLNGCLFIATVVSLRKTVNAQRQLKINRNYISTYAKMSTLTGINWSFSLVSVLVDSVVIKYAFVIVCGLQGVYIFVSFVCTRNVLRLCQECLAHKGFSSSGRSTQEKRISSH